MFNSSDENQETITLESFQNLSHDNLNIESFYNGVYCLQKNKLLDAKNYFLVALNGTEETEAAYYEYLSFLGLAEVLLNKSTGGLSRCYEAVNGFSNNSNLYFYIAYAEYFLGNRRRSVFAIEKLLENNPNHKYANFFNKCMVQRINLRNNIAHNIIGKLFRKKKECPENGFDIVFKDHLTIKINKYIQTASI